MNKTLLIATSEYLRRVRSKWFIAATLLVPVLGVAALAGASEVDRFEVHEPPLSDIFRQAVQGAGLPAPTAPSSPAEIFAA